MLRGREAEVLLRDANIHPNLTKCIVAICEDNMAQQQALNEFASSLDKLITIVSDLTIVGENMKKTIQRIRGKNPDDDFETFTD
jgi:uncharacterized protein with HEPN domain